ncbi:hypothetical protein D9757_005755 [Collybiopsis confluens]|uniref:Transcription factor BYE1 n=1 Tax=Collybiopsis confluens TaxID=2823264 RepID=A0A8H5MAG9_9AGAR|nr:hypothetical protein D9757_005755 [Collybiopsis confluens]
MNTRSTRATRASSRQTVAASSASPKKVVAASKPQDVEPQIEKENKKLKDPVSIKTSKPQSKPLKSKTRETSAAPSAQMFCWCKQGDDGTPMIHCTECKNWFHFSCIDLNETDAEDISVYVCSSCSEKTGLYSVSSVSLCFFFTCRTGFMLEFKYGSSLHRVLEVELPQFRGLLSNIEPVRVTVTGLRHCGVYHFQQTLIYVILNVSWEQHDQFTSQEPGPTFTASNPRKHSETPKNPQPSETHSHPAEPPADPTDLSSASEDSDDDYVVDARVKGNRGKRRIRRPSYVSESEDSDRSGGPASRIRKASSPTLKRIAKRDSGAPPPKKPKVSDPSDDPTRKYCLGKLEDVFRDIFLRYPHVHSQSEDDEGAPLPQMIEKLAEDLTEEEKEAVLGRSRQFADDLEKCIFEIHSEPDKQGKAAAAAKYKDRFRMLQFNLSKIDRVVLHKRIVSGRITPKEISVMSSTDLANEELKQSIKSAEQESLQQSILTKTSAPRAKITHKGLEDIEDISGRDSTRERERQLEEEERMERERLARLRTVQPRERTMSISIPPESPVVSSNESWGAPPPVPAHAADMSTEAIPARPPLFLNTSSEIVTEPELNLADLINIDDEPSSAQDADAVVSRPSPSGTDSSPTPVQSPAGISPFAIQPAPSLPIPDTVSSASPAPLQPSTPQTPAFDLNVLWSLSSVPSVSASISPSDETDAKLEVAETKDMPVDSSANDQDFDMFLEEQEPEKAEDAQAKFDALPQVWTGKINMPLDSAVPQETLVMGRQVGGRTIDVTSGQWRTLFPSDTLRIDGRVPVENSAKFLLQMRMTPSRELIAVAFSPEAGTDGTGFKVLSDFLINKGRHGLVFPWGNKPKDHHPGKELYIIPLLTEEALPEYMELLDDLRLPKVRTSNYLVGIWILNKGRLASPPPIPLTPIAAPVVAPVSSALSISPPPAIPVPSMNPAPGLNITNLAATLPVDQNALLSELASLTPEQMAFVTQMLSGTKSAVPTHPPIPGPSVPTNPASAQIPVPVLPPPSLPQPVDRRWGSQPPYSAHSAGGSSTPPSLSHMGGSERGGGAGGFNNTNSRGRGGRGGRGRGPVDSGWPRKTTGGQRRW